MTILQEKNPRNKRPCHSLWCLRLPLSYVFGQTLQLMATVWGALAGPKQTATLGRAICMVDGWLMVQKSSAVKKPCHCSEKEWPYFCILFFFLLKLSHSLCSTSSPRKQSLLFTEWQAHSGVEAGWHLWRWPRSTPCAEQGQLQQLARGCVQLCFDYFQAWNSPAPLSGLLLICTLYLQNPRVPWLCGNSKRHHSVASAETMLPFTSCLTVGGSRGGSL